ncbi:hypothetical protein LTS18_002753 [Coniosporium uncinatum]|uniref:Uncharacterized protein n=1 Tax=Coniosporium uncinatum TaxID=93489 RepID=A0ACC3D7P0_9PEZI|nr:hypothetical protein LTS18_002753 [Coniosporium uncinatum]
MAPPSSLKRSADSPLSLENRKIKKARTSKPCPFCTPVTPCPKHIWRATPSVRTDAQSARKRSKKDDTLSQQEDQTDEAEHRRRHASGPRFVPWTEQIKQWRYDSKRTLAVATTLVDTPSAGRGRRRPRRKDHADTFMGKVHVHEQRGAIKHAREVEGKEAGISMVMWTDGSCLSDGSTAAAVVYKMPHSRTQYVDVYEREELKPRRSIEAEMLALMAALATVVEMLGKGVGGALHGMGIGQVEVLTDSTSSLSLIEHDVEGAWRMFRDRGLAGVEGEEDDPEGGGGDAERHVTHRTIQTHHLPPHLLFLTSLTQALKRRWRRWGTVRNAGQE